MSEYRPASDRKFITPKQRERLLILRQMADDGATRKQVLEAMGFSANRLATILVQYTGNGIWPVKFPDELFALPVKEKNDGIGRGGHVHTIIRKSPTLPSMDDLAERIQRDQAALHGPRLQHLIDEQRRYNLPRMGKLPEQMVA